MGPPRRKLLETETETLTPPPELPPNHHIGRVIKATGNNVYSVELPSSSAAAAASAASASEPAPTSEPTKTAQSHSSTAPKTILVELNPRFRSTIWLKRGSYVLVDTSPHLERGNKLKGEIVNVVRDEKEWRKAAYWPKEFSKQAAASLVVGGGDEEDEEEEESRVGELPPTDD